MPPLIDETGNFYGRLVVVERVENDNNNKPVWSCKCACGRETEVKAAHLRTGHTRSCGCLEREIHSKTVRVAQMRKADKYAERRADGDIAWSTTSKGYVVGYWPEHPLAGGKYVAEHWHEYWETHRRQDWVISAKNMGATIHHINGVRDDNRPGNLELRWPGRHPQGWAMNDIIAILRDQGFTVIPPDDY